MRNTDIQRLANNSSNTKTATHAYALWGVYTDAKTWVELTERHFDDMCISIRHGHAKELKRKLQADPALHKEAASLVAKVDALLEEYAGKDKEPTAFAIYTIYAEDGRKETGTRTELAAKAGVAYERIMDLTSGRRRYSCGWSLSEYEARRGKLKPGPKTAPEPQDAFFAMDEGAAF